MFPPVTLPVAETCPPVSRLPVTVLPVTLKLSNAEVRFQAVVALLQTQVLLPTE